MAQSRRWGSLLSDNVTENSLQQRTLVVLCREVHCGFEELRYLRSRDTYTFRGFESQSILEGLRLVHAHAN